MMTEVAESGGKPSSLPVPLPNNSNALNTDGGHNNGIHEKKEPSTNGDYKSPLKSPTKIPGLKKSPSTRIPKTPTRAGPKTPDEANDAQEKKKVPMNKIQVGAAPSPNLKTVRSKIGSLDNTSYKPGGGKVKIESKKLDWKAAPRIAAKNENYQPTGGDKKIPQQKLVWNAKSKIGSLENTTHKPGGGDKKIETIKLDFKGNAKPKIGSKENVKHMPGGGTVKIEEHKLDIKASSKIGSLDNVKYKPGGGDKKIFDDKEYLKQMAATSGAAVARSDSEQASASQNRSKSTSRKSSRDRKSPIHLLPNGGIGLAPKSSAEDGNSEKKPIDRPSGSSPLSDKEKGKANESSGSPKTPVDAEAEKIVSSEPPKINASSKPDTTIKGTDKNDNDINQKQSTATSKSEEKPTLKEETPSVAVAKPSPEKTVIKKEPIPSTPPKPEETSVGLDKSPRPESRGLDGPKTPKPEPEKLISTEVAPNNRQRVGETIDSNKPTVVKTEIGSLNKPQSGSIDSISKPGTPLPPLPASAKPPTAPDLTNSKPPTPNTEQSGNQSGSNSQPGSKPMTPNPDTKPTDEKAVPPPTPQPRDIDAKPGTPQTGGNVVAGQPRPVFRPPTGERRTDGSVATQRQQSPDFSPKFGVREPLSKDSQGKRMVSSPSTDDQDVGVGRPPQSSPALRREAMSPGKRPDFRNDPMNMRPKTSDAKLQDPQRDSSKVMKNLENASQRQEQYQSMRNLADRSGSPKVGASTEGSQDLQRAASPNPVKSVVMPPKDG